jgi:hypothetical protein
MVGNRDHHLLVWKFATLVRIARSMSRRPTALAEAVGHLFREAQHQVAEAWRSGSVIPSKEAKDVFPGIMDFRIPLEGAFQGCQGYLIPAVASWVKARVVFEFGTAEGITALRVAEAISDWGGEVITVDLPPDIDVSRLGQSWADARGIHRVSHEHQFATKDENALFLLPPDLQSGGQARQAVDCKSTASGIFGSGTEGTDKSITALPISPNLCYTYGK